VRSGRRRGNQKRLGSGEKELVRECEVCDKVNERIGKGVA
jgi:hypothetical protein